MSFLVACKNEEDPIKNEGARVVTTLFIDLSDALGQLTLKSVMESRAANSEVSNGTLPKFNPIRAFVVGLVTCKNEDLSKNEVTNVVTTFLPL